MTDSAPSQRLSMTLLTLLLLLSLLSAHAHRRLTPNYPGDDGHRREVEVPLPTDPEDHRIVDLPLHDGSLTTAQYAGLLPASGAGDKYFFYWFFHPDLTDYKGKEEDIPLVLWLNGGPACSSMDGLFIEHGPLQLELENGNWKVTSRPTSWHKSPAYMLYVDQPVGTGLSFTTSKSYPRNDEEVNIDFYYWLQQFLQLHANVLLSDDKKQTKRPFHFSGESHAGHYIPSMMAYIQKQNQNSPSLNIQLSGAAIGNGWMDPYHQYSAAAAAYGHGLIGRAQLHALDEKEKQCQAGLSAGKYSMGVCFGLLDEVVSQSYGKSSHYKVSQYDIRQQEPKRGSRTFPPGHKIVESYLGGSHLPQGTMASNVNDVLAALHATPSRSAGQIFQECTDPPYNALSHQDGLGVTGDVKYLLEAGVKLLFFNGVMDLVCNHVGNEVFLEMLEWSHQQDYIMAPRSAWMSDASSNNKVAGYMKEYQNLSYLKVLDSGHMVPLDQPEICLDMMKTFLYGLSFQSSQQDLQRALEKNDPSCSACPECPAANAPDDGGDGVATESLASDPDVAKFVIAHSWVGALLAVSVFLGFFFVMKRRSSARSVVYGDIEMKSEYEDGVRYRDSEPTETDGRII